jgi:preprotein translocase subunit SecD
MNRYPLWKYIALIVVIIGGILYSLPNLYSKDYAIQISARSGFSLDKSTTNKVTTALSDADLQPKSVDNDGDDLLIRFTSPEDQLKANDIVKQTLGNNYVVALNLASTTPAWLQGIGAEPMKLGLDLSGGVHFLLAIDVDALLKHRLNATKRSISETLRKDNIRYKGFHQSGETIVISLRNRADLDNASDLLSQNFPELQKIAVTDNKRNEIRASLSPAAIIEAQNYAVEKSMTVLRNRINELGVNEPIVQQQGANRISVDLPGVQDTARAKNILGGTATLEFHLQDTQHDAQQAVNGSVPLGSKLFRYNDVPVLLKDRAILTGESITGATSSIGEDGKPAVVINLGGGGEGLFYRVTGENIGKPLAIVYVETVLTPKVVNGDVQYISHKTEKVINIATIRDALGNSFQISGLDNAKEARDLALQLRAGSLPTPIAIIEESTVGPSLGKENIAKGIYSIEAGFIFIVIFMAIYYRFFGLLANLALGANLLLLVAVLSLLGATLTLPGIAGIVLTVGMAVDANVLIFERIREELRNGMSPQASIQAGYERAFSTIVDSNVTTLIAAVSLLMIGTGAVKGFAVTLTIGIITSMFTAITGTRAIVNLVYGRKKVNKLSIGI